MPIKRLLLLAVLSAFLIIAVQTGCDELITEQITIIDTIAGLPTAEFTLADSTPGIGCEPCTVLFVDESRGPRHVYTWSFGDGDTLVETIPADSTIVYEAPLHIYEEAGVYTVSLHLLDTMTGGADRQVKQRFIYVGATSAEFEASDTNQCTGSEIAFVPFTYFSGKTYEWDFGDGSDLDSSWNPTHVFESAGLFVVTLVTEDDCGEATHQLEVDISNCPTVRFYASDSSVCVDDEITFHDDSEPGEGEVITPESQSWYFGDGQSVTGNANPTHSYTFPGDYTVRLTVNSTGGEATDSIVDFIHVANTTLAGFVVDEASTLACKTDFQQFQVKFENASMGAFDSLRWYFGDGFSDTGQAPIHAYTTPGIYTCSLVAYGPCGANTAIEEDLITLCDTLLAEDILIQVDTTEGDGTAGSTFQFTDVSTEGIVTSRAWYLGTDPLGQNVTQVQTIIDTDGTYWVKLTRINDCGAAIDSVELIVPVP